MIGTLTAIMCCISVVCSIYKSNTQMLSRAAVESCTEAVELAIYLVGTMALWGGLMRIAEKCGITKVFCRLLHPVTKLLFRDCDEKTMKNISMNLTANMLGLANAATPLGIAAVKGMSARKGRYMRRNIAMLTVLNTASIQLIPTTVGTLRAAHASKAPFEITVPILIVSLVSAAAGCTVIYALSLRSRRHEAE